MIHDPRPIHFFSTTSNPRPRTHAFLFFNKPMILDPRSTILDPCIFFQLTHDPRSWTHAFFFSTNPWSRILDPCIFFQITLDSRSLYFNHPCINWPLALISHNGITPTFWVIITLRAESLRATHTYAKSPFSSFFVSKLQPHLCKSTHFGIYCYQQQKTQDYLNWD